VAPWTSVVYPFLVSSTTYHLSHDPDTDEYHEPQYTVFYTPNNSDGGKGFFVVAVDGACPGNGPSNGIAFNGIYFSPSPFNDHGHLLVGTPQTNQHAEIYAAIKAMKKVTEFVASDKAKNLHLVADHKLIVMTDSAYLVNSISKHIFTWVNNGFRNSRGIPVGNRQAFETLHSLIKVIEETGLEVQFRLVPRGKNQDADRLADWALDGDALP
jgi:ribonuclease HI